MGKTTIEWTSYQRTDGTYTPGYSFNPWRGCTKVSDGCKNCYAETLSGRNPVALGVWGPKGTRVIASEAMWREPLKWNEKAKQAGERHRVFCASLADVFEGRDTMPEESYPHVTVARERLLETIRDTPYLDWLLLTKRPENIQQMVSRQWWESGFPPNVWIGTSVENQQTADERIPHLLKVPAVVRFLSCEPLLGEVDLRNINTGSPVNTCSLTGGWSVPQNDGSHRQEPRIHWVIAGGESGPRARPLHPDWARSLRDQCQTAQVSFFFKQWGEWLPEEQMDEFAHGDLDVDRCFYCTMEGERLYKVGKKFAGRLLDGREWNEFPEV